MIMSILVGLFTVPLEYVFWIKCALAYLSIRIYNALHRKKRFYLYDIKAVGDAIKLGYITPQVEKELESPLPECHLKEASDEIIIYGTNSKSECLFVRISRGCDQLADACIYLKLANGKTYSLIETSEFQLPFDGKCPKFSCGQLQMHYLIPMRKWRVFFCGMLKQNYGKQEDEESVFVKFAFLWKATSHVYDCTFDTNPEEFTKAIAKSEWKMQFLPPINRVADALNFYAESGIVAGTVSVNGAPDYEMYLSGEKIRNIGKNTELVGFKFTKILGYTHADGFSFHLANLSLPNALENLSVGYTVDGDAEMKVLQNLDIKIEPSIDGHFPRAFKANFRAGAQHEIEGKIMDSIEFNSKQGWNGSFNLSFIKYKIGTKRGNGFLVSGEILKETKRDIQSKKSTPISQKVSLTVKLQDEISQFGRISGGKGSSLGKLTQLSKETKTFSVPKGIVVTTSSYSKFLTSEIIDAIKDLENVAHGNKDGHLKDACNRVARVIDNSLLPNAICQAITDDLKDIFGNKVNKLKFAVRSSATGEDTATMSAAGQMDTFLGVKGFDEIFKAVKKSWASQFGRIAVEYKKRYGQVLNSPMAVVIQEMVACEVSGVMFTCDPVTNNPSFITITANYGLGETVVSGSVEPDTFILQKNDDDTVELDYITVGSKKQKIVMKDSGGIVVEDIDETTRNESCLSRETVERLGKLSLEIEKFYRSSRDIEWGILNDRIYILQSRPVTNIAAETDYELKHEFDLPIRSENIYFTLAHVGEVLPGATSPLAIELVSKFYAIIMKRSVAEKGFMDNSDIRYFPSGTQAFCNHMTMAIAEIIASYGADTPMAKGLMISMFGRILDDPEFLQCAKGKVKEGMKPSFRQQLKAYWDLFMYDLGLQDLKKRIYNYNLDFLKGKTAKETFQMILNSCSDFDKAGVKHIECTEGSSNWNMAMFSILCESKGDFDDNIYSDFATLLASSSTTASSVESATVPQAMEELAIQIEKDIDSEKFRAMSIEKAEEWLKTTSKLAGKKFVEFLKRHGHRCLKEFDVHSITWGMDSKLLVKLLQNLVGVTRTDKRNEDDINKIISKLHTPLSSWAKFRLKHIVLPNCRRGVRGREAGKSIMIKCIDHWRKGFRHLAKLMVSEGRLPEEELLFFLTFDEINDLLNTRSPTILSRATQRKRIHPILAAYKFPELMKGLPIPINDEEESAKTYQSVADLSMKGVPVSQGVVKGYARVAISLEEASLLKPGEILITHSTDIGWSPYFPIVSGVVTEIGGLISHGAVVSREYGLPCVVGLPAATKMFRTGDYVLLDGTKGIIQRLQPPQ